MSYNLVEIDPISGEHKLKKVAGLSKLNVWTGTQSDYNAQKNTIPNGSYVNITDDAESGNGIKDIYSTDEVKTNKVWIDGKPIYRKCIQLTNLTADSEIDVTSLNIDKCLNLGGFIEDSSMIVNIGNYYVKDYSNCGAFYKKENKRIRFQKDSNVSNTNNGYLILEYTKTS